MTSLNTLRGQFLEYFGRHGHEIVDSAPLVPRNDPTLLFTNAGMVPFKNIFTGAEHRAYARAASAQKCVRAGGKHNDLDNVGYTARHLTFFEMLGNFSFGDYFKAEAIDYAWHFLRGELDLPEKRLLATVYVDDDEAFGLWKKIAGLPDSRIVRIAGSDNFWSMGDTGPCGPCSEIFFDHGDHVPGGPPGSPEAEGDRFVEIWNLVFMQYEQHEDGTRTGLPRPSIDTGMGLERIAAVMQGAFDVYDTDLFRTLIETSAAAAGAAPDGEHAVSHRVIADHLRSASFLIADGVLPANEGRGYVLRRIMRRAMRHAHTLGVSEPLMWKLVPTLVGEMGRAYPELGRAEALITETLRLEEERFRETLARGLRLLDDAVSGLNGQGTLPGEVAFRLYDTYGFPVDLTEDVLRDRGLKLDRAGFEEAMARQRAEARAAWAGSGEAATGEVWYALHDEFGATDFLGYDMEAAEGQVLALLKDGARVDEAVEGDEVAIILNQTPFYGESGGQVGDTGVMFAAGGAEAAVADTQKKLGDMIVHAATVRSGTLKVGDVVEARVDGRRRNTTRANHSATHLLHAALRKVLGAHVTQKGSLVAPDRLRFDFSHPRPLTREEIGEVEAQVNAVILQNDPVSTRLMAPDQAIEAGALALFGEKYGDEVRVLAMGRDGDAPFSVELCGGTHVRRTGDIGLFKIIGESAVSAGVRRVEALTGEAARRHLTEQEAFVREAAAALKTAPSELPGRVKALVEERRRLERDLAEARRKAAMGGGETAGPEIREVTGVRFLGRVLHGVNPRELRGLVDEAKRQVGSGIVALITVSEGKATLAVGVTDDLTDTYDAVPLVRRGAQIVGGKGGGGRPDMAQAGGPQGEQAEAALTAIGEAIGAMAGAA